MIPELERRKRATEKTLKQYRGKVFSWSKGVTCIHLARTHLRNMGHKPPVIPRFRSAIKAKKVMTEKGWASTVEMFDSLLPRISPANMMMGDIAVICDELDDMGNPRVGMGAIYICAGPRKVFGWREDQPKLIVLDVSMGDMIGAWRV